MHAAAASAAMVLLQAVTLAAIVANAPWPSCTRNEDCPKGNYCHKPELWDPPRPDVEAVLRGCSSIGIYIYMDI